MLLPQRLLRSAPMAVALIALVTAPLWAQGLPGEAMASQSLRAYRFVFIAYALAWILVFGWVLTVSLKLSRLARRLED